MLKIFEDFVLDKCSQTFNMVISQVSAAATPKAVALVNASEDEVFARRKMLSRLSSDDLKMIEEEIRSSWSLKRNPFSPYMRANFPSEPSQKFWGEHYYPVLFLCIHKEDLPR